MKLSNKPGICTVAILFRFAEVLPIHGFCSDIVAKGNKWYDFLCLIKDYLTLKTITMKWGFILAGIAGAIGYYLYSSLTEEQKKEMVDNLKQKGKKMYDDYVPNSLKSKISEVQ